MGDSGLVGWQERHKEQGYPYPSAPAQHSKRAPHNEKSSVKATDKEIDMKPIDKLRMDELLKIKAIVLNEEREQVPAERRSDKGDVVKNAEPIRRGSS